MSENKIYTVEEIMEMLPHRYPFCWLTDWKSRSRVLKASV